MVFLVRRFKGRVLPDDGKAKIIPLSSLPDNRCSPAHLRAQANRPWNGRDIAEPITFSAAQLRELKQKQGKKKSSV